MQPIRIPWGRKARARRQAARIAAAREWQEHERSQAWLRIAGLARTLDRPDRRP